MKKEKVLIGKKKKGPKIKKKQVIFKFHDYLPQFCS